MKIHSGAAAMRTSSGEARPIHTLCILLLISLTGCQGAYYGYANKYVNDMDRVPISDMTQQYRLWQGPDLMIDYTSIINNGRLNLSGTIAFADRVTYNFPRIKYFHLDILFVDSQGKVLSAFGVISGTALDSRDRLAFSRVVPVPDRAVSFAFSYSGDAVGDDDDGGGSNSFWHFPVH